MSYPINVNIPNAPNNPADDQPLMKANFGNINDFLKVDHVAPGTANDGYHTVIHQKTQGANPGNIPGINQVYSKIYTPDSTVSVADTQLFCITGLGGVSQLTGGNAQTDGWQWIGSVLIQWGKVTSNASTGNVTFRDRVAGAIPFPNNLFNVIVSARVSAVVSLGNVYVSDAGFSRLGFTWVQARLDANQTGLYWVAIGN